MTLRPRVQLRRAGSFLRRSTALAWRWLAFTAFAAANEPGLLPSGWEEGEPPAFLREGLTLSEAGENKAQALASYFAGLAAVKQRSLQEATEKFREALRRDPANLRLARRLAELYTQARQPQEGLAVLEQALANNPHQPVAYLQLSEFCAKYHEGNEAVRQRGEAVARQAVALFPSEAAAHANLASWLWGSGVREEAAQVLRDAAAREETSPAYWLELAQAASHVWSTRTPEGRATIAGLYEKALQLAPQEASVVENVADFHALHGALMEAADLYERLVKLRPDHLVAREKLARALALTNRPEEAAATWRTLLEIDPQHAKAHEALARHAARQGDLVASVRHRAEALRWNSGADTWREGVSLARDMLALGMEREALAVLERASFQAPDAFEPSVLSAFAYARLKEFARAAACFARAEEIILASSASDTATTSLLNDEFYYEWGLMCEAAGLLDEAEAKLRRAINVTPADAPEKAAKSYNALAYLWLEHDRHIDEAGPLIQRALQFEPENPAYLDTLGWLHFKKRQFQEAVAVLTRAHQASPEPVAEILDHLAQAQWEAGDRPTAVSTLQQAVALPDATDTMHQRLDQWRAALANPSP